MAVLGIILGVLFVEWLALVVWALIEPDAAWDVERCDCEDNEDECPVHGLMREGY